MNFFLGLLTARRIYLVLVHDLVDREEQKRRELVERVGKLHGGLEDLVAAMTIKSMKRRLEELGANPRRLASCLEKV